MRRTASRLLRRFASTRIIVISFNKRNAAVIGYTVVGTD
jgi:hypothetical protein